MNQKLLPEDVSVLLQPRQCVFLEFKRFLLAVWTGKDFPGELGLEQGVQRRERFRQIDGKGISDGETSVAKVQRSWAPGVFMGCTDCRSRKTSDLIQPWGLYLADITQGLCGFSELQFITCKLDVILPVLSAAQGSWENHIRPYTFWKHFVNYKAIHSWKPKNKKKTISLEKRSWGKKGNADICWKYLRQGLGKAYKILDLFFHLDLIIPSFTSVTSSSST